MTNNKTTIGTIITVIGLIPLAITKFDLATLNPIFVNISLVCSVIGFIYAGVSAKDA